MATILEVAESEPVVQLTAKDFKGQVDPDWCVGCGDFGVLNSLQRACAGLGLRPHEIITVSGIGCSSNTPGYFNSYGMHTLHGRALAVATGVKLATASAGWSGRCGDHADRLGFDPRRDQRGAVAVARPRGARQSTAHQVDRAVPCRGGGRYPCTCEAHDNRRKHLFRTVRPVPTE